MADVPCQGKQFIKKNVLKDTDTFLTDILTDGLANQQMDIVVRGPASQKVILIQDCLWRSIFFKYDHIISFDKYNIYIFASLSCTLDFLLSFGFFSANFLLSFYNPILLPHNSTSGYEADICRSEGHVLGHKSIINTK